MGEVPEQVYLVGCPPIATLATLPAVNRAPSCGPTAQRGTGWHAFS